MSGEPSLMSSVAKSDSDFGGDVVFESGGDGSVDDFSVPGDTILIDLNGYVVVWALIDDIWVVGSVDFVGSVAEEVREGLVGGGAIMARGWVRVVEGTEWFLTRPDSILGFTGEHGRRAEIFEGDGAWAVGMVIDDG